MIRNLKIGYSVLTLAIMEIMELESPLSTIPIFCSGVGKGTTGGNQNMKLSNDNFIRDFDAEVATASPHTPPQLKDMKLNDGLYYIYTSGTTGMPKAAIIKQYRFLNMTTMTLF